MSADVMSEEFALLPYFLQLPCWIVIMAMTVATLILLRLLIVEVEVRALRGDLDKIRPPGLRQLIARGGFLKIFREIRRAIVTHYSHSLGEVDFNDRGNCLPRLMRELSIAEVWQIILHDAMVRFSADVVCVLNKSHSEARAEIVHKARKGVVGERLEHVLRERFRSFFDHHDLSQIGVFDHLLEEGKIVNIPLFGLHVSISGIVGGVEERIMWIGYEKHDNASQHTSKQVANYLIQIGRLLDEYFEVKDLKESYSIEREQNNVRTKLLAYASHDMRAPINNLKAICHLIESQDVENTHREEIERALYNCRMLSEIVDDALDYSRLKAGALVVRKEKEMCSTIIKQVVQGFAQLAFDKGLVIASFVDGDLVVEADLRQLRRILSNLLGNAIKYTENGSIEVRASYDDRGFVAIIVSDTGIGMSGSEVSEMFSPYRRFADDRSEGEGLGLALCQAFAELNGCRFDVASDPGAGTTITLSVPGSIHKCVELVGRGKFKKVVGQGTILVVDDDREYSESLRRPLELDGFSVQIASSIKEAQALMRYLAPQAIITDLTFPDGRGETLVSWLLLETDDLPVIVASGRDFYEEHRNLGRNKRVHCFRKPIDLTTILKCIGSLDRRAKSDRDAQFSEELKLASFV